MREIKFRGWYDNGLSQNMFFVGDSFNTTHPLDCCKYLLEGQPVTLMQYTGLNGKNGVEIYEGDVVNFDVRPSWEPNSKTQRNQIGIVDIQPSVTAFGSWDSAYCYNITVLGNIYQNPELLKENKNEL